jgi:predicted CXXCH cytochrome family protein
MPDQPRSRTPGRRGGRRWFCLALAWPLCCAIMAFRSSAATESQPTPAPAPAPAPKKPESRKAVPPDPDTPGPDAQFVGSTFCGAPACHGAMMPEFNTLRHSRYVSDTKFKDAAGCEVCHGPASDHVGDPDHRKIYRFTVQTRENATRVNEACIRCHQETIRRPHFMMTEHARAGLSCASCHEVHYDLKTPYLLRHPGVGGTAGQPQSPRKKEKKRSAAPAAPPVPAAAPAIAAGAGAPDAPAPEPNRPRLEMLAKTRVPLAAWRTSFPREPGAVTDEQAVNEMCASCHSRQAVELRQFSHHPMLEGRMKCTDCHQPHEQDRGRSPGRRTIAETGLQCHPQVRGPFVFEHDPVKAGGVGDDCLECHRPHGSPNRKLQVLFSRGLCVQCHTDIQRDPAHQNRRGDCWRAGCHIAIHGSNHSRLFFLE